MKQFFAVFAVALLLFTGWSEPGSAADITTWKVKTDYSRVGVYQLADPNSWFGPLNLVDVKENPGMFEVFVGDRQKTFVKGGFSGDFPSEINQDEAVCLLQNLFNEERHCLLLPNGLSLKESQSNRDVLKVEWIPSTPQSISLDISINGASLAIAYGTVGG